MEKRINRNQRIKHRINYTLDDLLSSFKTMVGINFYVNWVKYELVNYMIFQRSVTQSRFSVHSMKFRV